MSDPGNMPTQNNGGPQDDQYASDFFTYVFSIGSLASAASTQINQQVQADSTFEWVMTTWNGNKNGGTTPFPDTILLPVSIQLIDSASGRQLFSAAVPITSIAGTGKQPFILPVSRFFMARTNIQLVATNFGADTYDNLFFNMIGRKLFKKSKPAGV